MALAERFNISLGLDASDARRELAKIKKEIATVSAGKISVEVPASLAGDAKQVAGLVKQLVNARSEVRELEKEKRRLAKVNWDKLNPEEKKSNKAEMRRIKAELEEKKAIIVQAGTKLDSSVGKSEKTLTRLAKKISDAQKALDALNASTPKSPVQQKLQDEAKKLDKQLGTKQRELARVRAEIERVKQTAIEDYRKQGPGSSGRIFPPARAKREKLQAQERALVPRVEQLRQLSSTARQLATNAAPVTKEIKELTALIAQLTSNRKELNSYVLAARTLVQQNDIPLRPRIVGKKEGQNLSQFDPFEPMSRRGSKGANRSAIASEIANQIIKSGKLRSNNNQDAGVVPNAMLAALVAIKAIPAELAQSIAKLDVRTGVRQQQLGGQATPYQTSRLPINFAGDLSMAGLIRPGSTDRLVGKAISDIEQSVADTGGTAPQGGAEWGVAVFERMKTIIEQQYAGDEQATARINQIVLDLKQSLEPIAKLGIGVLAGEASDLNDDSLEMAAMSELGDDINDLAAVIKENSDSEDDYNANSYSEDDVRTKVDKTGAVYSVLDNGMSGTSPSNEANKNINDDNAFVRRLLTDISYGDKGGGRIGGTLDLDSEEAILRGFEKGGFNIADLIAGFFPISASDNPKNIEDDAEARMPVITAAQFKEAVFIAMEAARLINLESKDLIRELRAQRGEGFNTGLATHFAPRFSTELTTRTRPGQYLADWEAAYGGEEEERTTEGPKGKKEKGGLRWVNVAKDLEEQGRQRAAWLAATEGSGTGNIEEYNGSMTQFKTGNLTALKAPFEKVVSVLTRLMTEGVRNPELIPLPTGENWKPTGRMDGLFPEMEQAPDSSTRAMFEGAIGELIPSNIDLFQKTFEMLPFALQDLITLAHDYAVATGSITKSGEAPFNQDFNGTVVGLEPSLSTFEQMFNANVDSPASGIEYERTDGTKGRVPTGYGPGQLEPVNSIGVTKPLIVSVLDEFAKQFEDIYGAKPGAIVTDENGKNRPFGQTMGTFDPKTFLPAMEGQLDAVRLSYIEAFTKNREAYLEFISSSTTKLNDITMALPAVEQLFEYVSSFKEGAAGGYNLDEVKNARNMFQHGATPTGSRSFEMGGYTGGTPGVEKQPVRFGQEFGMRIPAASRKLAGDAIFGGFDTRSREARERNRQLAIQQTRTPEEVEKALAAKFEEERKNLEVRFLDWAAQKGVGSAEEAGRAVLERAKKQNASNFADDGNDEKQARILTTGSREFTDEQAIAKRLSEVMARAIEAGIEKITFVHGDGPGADQLVSKIINDFKSMYSGIEIAEEKHPADWDANGKAAGPIRNKEMVGSGIDQLIAFFKEGAGNRGTQGTVDLAKQAGIPVAEIVQSASDIVTDVANGISGGVSAKEGEIAQEGKRIGKIFGGGTKDELEINSPSKYFERIGESSVDGLIEGSKRRLRDLNEAGRAMAESFNSGYSDQAKVDAIAKIEELENTGMSKAAEAIKKAMRSEPASEKKAPKPRSNGKTDELGYTLSTPAEIQARNKPAVEAIKALKAANEDLIVAIDVESTGGRSPGHKRGAMRNRVWGYGMVAGYGESSREATPGGTGEIVRPNLQGISHGMVVPPVDPQAKNQRFALGSAAAVGLTAMPQNGASPEEIAAASAAILPALIERIKGKGYGDEKTTGSEQEYVKQLEDIAALLTQLYESGVPLAMHNRGLSDLKDLGKEFAQYQISAPTAGQFRDAGLLVETQNFGEMLSGILKDAGVAISKSVGGIYKFFSGKEMGPELIPQGNAPVYAGPDATAHDPIIDASATLVDARSMADLASKNAVKQIGLFGKTIQLVEAAWTDISNAIFGFREYGAGSGGGKKKEPLVGLAPQVSPHDPNLVQPTPPVRPPVKGAPLRRVAPVVTVDPAIADLQNEAQKRQAYEAELAKLLEAREIEKERLRKENLRLERQYKIDMVEQLMSENMAIGFNNITNSQIPGRVISDKEKARIAGNNKKIADLQEDPDIANGVKMQLDLNKGVREFFTAPIVKASREVADEIQKAIDKAKRAIRKMDIDSGAYTPAPRGPRGPNNGPPPRGPRGPGGIGGGPDDPTPEYKQLQNGEITGNQNAAWLDMETERQQAANKRASEATKNILKDQVAFEKEMEKTNRKMVDSWISTRYSLYDVASTYEDMGKKLKVFTSYIQQAIMVNSSYETSFTAVERVMQPLPDEIDGMRQRLVLMTQELPVAFNELARIATLGGQMGINADGINNFTEQVVKYSAITGMSADTVAEKFGRISQLADIPADDFNKLASAVAYAGINAVATDQEIITLTESISAASNLAGFGADETIGLATAISSLGIAPEQARGVIVRLFGDIERGMQNGGKELDAYSKHLGLSAKETKNLWETDPQGFFKRMLTNLSTSKSMTTSLDNLNIKETREVNTLQRLAKNMDVYNQSMSDAQESYANGTFLGEAYAKTQDNVAAKMTILSNELKVLQDNIGEAFGEPLKFALDMMSEFMKWINKIISNPMGKWLVGITAALSALVAGFIAYQVMTYKATAATLALKTSMLQLGKMGGEHTGIKGLIDVLMAEERMIIRSNGKIQSLSKDRLEAMQANREIQMVPANSPAGRALLNGIPASQAGNPAKLDEIIARKNGNVMDPMAENAGEILPGAEVPGPSIAQLQETIAINQQLLQLKADQIAKSLEAATAAELEAKAAGDLNKAKEQELIVAGLSRDQRQVGGLQETLAKSAKELQAPDLGGVAPEETSSNVEQTTAAIDEMGAGLGNAAVAADEGSAATTRFGKAVKAAAAAAGWIGMALTAVSTLIEVWKSFQINLEESGGGLDSFREAIYKDTAAWKENGEAIATVDSKVTVSKDTLTTWAQSMESTTGSSAKMTTAITETTDSIKKQTLALGANAMEWLAQAAMNDDVIQGMFKRYFDAGKDLGEISKKANVNLQDMIGMSLASPGENGAEKYLRDYFDASSEVAQSSPGLYDDLKSIALQLDSTTASGVSNSKMMKALNNGFKETDPDELNKKLKETTQRVYTLTDYVGDLSSILSGAFTIRYGKEEATDQLASSWDNVKNRIDEARLAIEKIKDEIKSMTADRNILEYQLNIALKYGDNMRADKIRAELDAKNKELADKDKELSKSQDSASTSLVGNTTAAADNRAVMRGLVQDYNKYLEALANTSTYEGLSDKQVAKKKKWLKEQADQAKADMLAKGASLGFSENEMTPYIKSFKDFRTIVDKLPKELTLRVDADPGTRAFMEWWAKTGKNASGSGASSTKTGTGVGPDGKPKKPMWDGAKTDPSGNIQKPDMLLGGAKAMFDDWMTNLSGGWSGIFDNPIVNQYKTAGSQLTAMYRGITEGWEGYYDEIQKNQGLYPHMASLLRDQDAWNKANAIEQRKILEDEIKFNAIPAKLDRMDAPTKEREKMAKEHASLYPGEYNPFNGKQNPGKPKNFGGDLLGNTASMSSKGNFKRNNMNPNAGKNAAAVGAEKIFADYQAKVAMKNNYVAAGASEKDAESLIAKNGKVHAQRHPGEYNPFTRKQNPWPSYKADLDSKGLVPLRDRAALHAAMYPGEYNPFTQLPNDMNGGDAGMIAAMKNKKTRLALGAEHERLYPGEYNPYLEKLNPMFDKNAKADASNMTTSDIKKVKGGTKAATILDYLDKRDSALAAAAAAEAAIAQGSKKAKPIYTSITNIKDLADIIAGNTYTGGKIGYASGGLIPGKSPQNPRADNLLAAGPGGLIGIRSGEFIQSQPAVKYYGLDFMNAINNLQIPRYASGGMIGTVSGGGSSVVELSPSAVMQIMAIANRPVNLYSDDRQIASSANRGNMLLAMRGSN